MNIYWIGARQWDIKDNDMFVGSVTRYGEDSDNNLSFCNNTSTLQYDEFLQRNLNNILKRDKDAYFLFANELSAYKYGNNIYEKSICVNNLSIIEALNDKIFARNFFSEAVDTPSSIVINTSSCLDYNFVKSVFNNKFSTFVLQEAKGAGGQETFFLTSDSVPQIPKNVSHLLVTPYYDNALSINLHIIVGDKSYKIMPPSIQITVEKFKYSGSDFIAYQLLDSDTKNMIIHCAKKIAEKVQLIGGRGVFGVDLLVTEGKVLFLECNYRYQGSSFLLNMGLQENGFSSLFQYRYNAFYNDLNSIPDDIYNIPIKFSSFRRTEWNNHIILPNPFLIIAPNNSNFSSKDKYKQYDLYKNTIIQNIAKQEGQNLYLFDP